MKFSQGGHLFACIDGTEIKILHSYTLKQLKVIPMLKTIDPELHSQIEFKQIIFNDKDQSIAVCGLGGYIGRWALPSYEPIQEKVYEDLNYHSIDFLNEESDANQVVVAGSQSFKDGPAGIDKLKIVQIVNSDTGKGKQ